jgi:MFS transporter, PAT family, beta-lactamase induction signal transducer AmpG
VNSNKSHFLSLNWAVPGWVSWKMVFVLLTGFSSGLPLALTAGTLQAWMSNEGVNLKLIGIFSLVGLPYTVKFLWSPFLDRFSPSVFGKVFLGRRRGWIFITQLLLAVSVFILSLTTPSSSPLLVALLALLISFFSASQDIEIDAYRTELLAQEERAMGSSVSIMGYRLAMLVSGAVALILSDSMPWSSVYQVMSFVLCLLMLSTLFMPEIEGIEIKPKTLKEAIIQPFVVFFGRSYSIEILLFILIYKIDIVMASALTTPFMLELGFSKTEIGSVNKIVGMIASIVGSLVGGALAIKYGLKKSLWRFGIIQGLSTLSFSLLAHVGKDNFVMGAVVGFENFCAGLATGPFIALLMTFCDKRYTATIFALLSSFAAMSRVFAGAPTGYLVDWLGWELFFAFCSLTAIPGLFLLYFRYDKWFKVETD